MRRTGSCTEHSTVPSPDRGLPPSTSASAFSVKTRNWVSGSSETKIYGKGVVLRAHEEQHTLPRRSLFGKVRVRDDVFTMGYGLFALPSSPFSGKLQYTTIPGGRSTSPKGPELLAETPTFKCLKYCAYCATVGFGTAAAANPTRTQSHAGCRPYGVKSQSSILN